MVAPKSILITGASSGIGAALARAYAGAGVRLALGGRDEPRLDRVVDACQRAGAEVEAALIDVTDRGAMADWVARADRVRPLDLVIANAGVSAGRGRGHGVETADQTRAIFAVNLDGVLNTVLPAIPLMRARGHGQIAIISSLSAFRGFPGAPAYSASKAAVRVWGEALRTALYHDGVAVSVVCPGFVESRISASNRFPMPMLMSADRAARIIRRRLARRRPRIAFPWPMYFAAWLAGALPPRLTDPLMRLLPDKE
ncbi:MAG: SDR family NAD(P)-dependent oxidoreductase [Kiloniellales bacterium]